MKSISPKSPSDIKAMRTGGKILAQVLSKVSAEVKPGVRPSELSALAGREVKRLGGEAAFLGHEGFPAPICISINDAVVHGIPNDQILRRGDIVGLDFGVRYQGRVTDGAVTVAVGEVDAETQRLLDVTQRALAAGIAMARGNNRVGDISAAVERVLKGDKLGVIQELVGHGVGLELWEEPQIPNYGLAGKGPKLIPGMTIAIEPMATLGSRKITTDSDHWTIRTADGSLAAQFEHTVLITDGAAEILTKA
jgi:methionyl aminopeptidase